MFKYLPRIGIVLTALVFVISPLHAEETPPTPSPTKIISLSFLKQSGLGNRLKKIISNLRYHNPKHLNLYWPTDHWVTTPFSKLFAPEWNITISEFNDPYLISNVLPYTPLTPWINEFTLLVAENEFKSGKHQFIDMQYNKIPPEIIKLYLPYFKALRPSPEVKKRISEVKLPKNAVAVQVRNAPDWKFYMNKEEPSSAFFRLMDTFPKDTIFYLSAMSKESAMPFYQRYPNRIIELPNKDYQSMIDATADMFILGQTKEAIYQYYSTFSEIAWWLGGAKAKVHIVGNSISPFQAPPTLEILKEFPKH